MNQIEFSKLKINDDVYTIYKGHVVSMNIVSIYDKGRSCRDVILKVPDEDKTILRHMYNIYVK